MAPRIIQLIPVSVYAERKSKDKSWVYQLINTGRLTAYQIAGKKVGLKPKTYLDPAEEPSEK